MQPRELTAHKSVTIILKNVPINVFADTRRNIRISEQLEFGAAYAQLAVSESAHTAISRLRCQYHFTEILLRQVSIEFLLM